MSGISEWALSYKKRYGGDGFEDGKRVKMSLSPYPELWIQIRLSRVLAKN